MANILLINFSLRPAYKNTLLFSLVPQVIQLSKNIKKISLNIFPTEAFSRCSALSEKSIKKAGFYAVCIGEGNFTLIKKQFIRDC
jgi:hypothetical protein